MDLAGCWSKPHQTIPPGIKPVRHETPYLSKESRDKAKLRAYKKEIELRSAAKFACSAYRVGLKAVRPASRTGRPVSPAPATFDSTNRKTQLGVGRNFAALVAGTNSPKVLPPGNDGPTFSSGEKLQSSPFMDSWHQAKVDERRSRWPSVGRRSTPSPSPRAVPTPRWMTTASPEDTEDVSDIETSIPSPFAGSIGRTTATQSPTDPEALQKWATAAWLHFGQLTDETGTSGTGLKQVVAACTKWLACSCKTHQGAFQTCKDLEQALQKLGRPDAATLAAALWATYTPEHQDTLPSEVLLRGLELHFPEDVKTKLNLEAQGGGL